MRAKQKVITLKVGTPVTGFDLQGRTILGMIIKTSDYGAGTNTRGCSYKIEWSDEYTDWYDSLEASGYAENAIEAIK